MQVSKRRIRIGCVMISLFLLFIAFSRSALIIESVSIVAPRNASQDIKNKLVCQLFTDVKPQLPRLSAADHFTLPLLINSSINVFQLSFSIVRMRNDADPNSITLALMYDNVERQSPGTVFFTKSVRAPNNPPLWSNESMGSVELISLNITQGEVSSSDSTVVFDFSNMTFLPRGIRLWVNLYVTGERHYVTTPSTKENVFYWCTTDKPAVVGETTTYFFRDESNILGKDFQNWTNATVIEAALGLNSGGKHMAWSLTLLAVIPTTILERILQVPLKELIIIIVCSVIGLLFLICCVLCICKRCKRCRYLRNHGKESSPVYQMEPIYKPVPQQQQQQIYESTESQVGLETLSEGASFADQMTPNRIKQDTASGKYIDRHSRIAINMKEGSYDKDK